MLLTGTDGHLKPLFVDVNESSLLQQPRGVVRTVKSLSGALADVKEYVRELLPDIKSARCTAYVRKDGADYT